MLTYVGRAGGSGAAHRRSGQGRTRSTRSDREDLRLHRQLSALPRRRDRHLQPRPDEDGRVRAGLVRDGPSAGRSPWRLRESGTAQGDGQGEGARRVRVDRELGEPWTGAPRPARDPAAARELWGKPGQRAWQYAGDSSKQPCQVLGLDVDINVADVGCLATPPAGSGHHGGRRQAPAGATRLVRRGSRGRAVQQLTRRLSILPSKTTGQPYLDGPRGSLGPEAETALKAFQREHRLDADGIYGPDTQRRAGPRHPARGARRQGAQKASRTDERRARAGRGTNGKPRKPAATLRGLIDEVRRLDAETDRAWQRLVAYGATRQTPRRRSRARARLRHRRDHGDPAADGAARSRAW